MRGILTMGDSMTVGENVKKARKSKGLTQQELGERMGVTQATVNQYESGKRNPKLDTLNRIANALGVNVGVLLYGENSTTIDRDGTKFSGPITPQEDIDEMKEEGIFNVTIKPAFREVGGAFVDALDEVTSSIVDVLQDMTEENKLLFLELAKKMSKKEGGDDK